jgi:hypothetical protein
MTTTSIEQDAGPVHGSSVPTARIILYVMLFSIKYVCRAAAAAQDRSRSPLELLLPTVAHKYIIVIVRVYRSVYLIFIIVRLFCPSSIQVFPSIKRYLSPLACITYVCRRQFLCPLMFWFEAMRNPATDI